MLCAVGSARSASKVSELKTLTLSGALHDPQPGGPEWGWDESTAEQG